MRDTAEDKVQHSGNDHHPRHEQTNHQRTAIHTVDIEERGNNNREDKNEEHSQLKRLRQLAHFLEERSDNSQGRDSQDDNQLVELTRQPQSQTGANSEEEDTQT